MAWYRPRDSPLSEPIIIHLPTHICVTRPQWVKQSFWYFAQNTAVSLPCSVQKFQSDWTTETDVMNEREFARFEFKMGFGQVSYVTHALQVVIRQVGSVVNCLRELCSPWANWEAACFSRVWRPFPEAEKWRLPCKHEHYIIRELNVSRI